MGDESLLELFADDRLSSVSPVPSDRSDDVLSTSLTTGAWDNDDEEQPERYSSTKSSRDPKGSLACRIASDKV